MHIFNKHVPALLLFIFVIILFFSNVIFGKKTLLSYGPGMYPPKNINQPNLTHTLQDNIASPWIDIPYSFINHSYIKNFTLPIWNPYSAIGYPLAADMESSAFFPLHLPSLFGLQFWDIFLMFRPILAMVFLYLFLREIQLRTIPAVLGAFLYSFSGFFIYYINVFILNADMLLPAALLYVTKIINKLSLLNFLLLILIFFLLLNSSNSQNALLGLIFTDFYFLYLILTVKENHRKKIYLILNCILINIISLGLSAYSYSLFLELYWNAWTIHPDGLASTHMNPVALTNFTFPYLIGYLGGSIFNAIKSTRIIPYFGIIATWLIFIGFSLRSHRRYVIFFTIFFSLWFLKLLGFPLFEPILKLPIITNIWFNKYVGTLFLSASILAAFGTQKLIDFLENNKYQENKSHVYHLVPLISASICFISLQLMGNYLGLNTSFKDFLPKYIDNNFISENAISQIIIGNAFLKWESVFVILSLIFSLVIIIKPLTRYFKVLVWVFSLALFFSVVIESYIYFPKIRSDKFDPAQKFLYVDFLRKDKDLFRIYGTGETIMPQENLFFGISDVRIVSPLLYKRYADFFRELVVNQPKEEYSPFLGGMDKTMSNVNNNLLSLMNVKYILSDTPLSSSSAYFPVFSEGVNVYMNKNYLPRVFLVDRVIPGLNQKQIFSYLKSASFLPDKKAIVEGATDEMITKLTSVNNNSDISTVIVKKYDPDNVIVDVLTDSTKLLVLSDLYYPGWEVYIDGREDKIFATNYIMRGVLIPEGHHVVEFMYRPNTFYLGLVISVLTLFFTGFIIKGKYIKFSYD